MTKYKWMIATLIILLLTFFAAACSPPAETPETETIAEQEDADGGAATNNSEENGATDMKLKINDEEVSVKWEDNESVRALSELAAKGPITIDTSKYGGFEQVGELGTTLPRNDSETTTKPGDIVLYSGSNIVVFFGSNSWAYTRLGHIEGKSTDELRDLLDRNDVVLTITSDKSRDADKGFDIEKKTVMLNSGYEMPIIGLGTWTLND